MLERLERPFEGTEADRLETFRQVPDTLEAKVAD